MEKSKVAKSSQEQAVAAWIEWLNLLRYDELLEQLRKQDINLAQALQELQKMKTNIAELGNRGGNDGIHGFIAEIAETGIANARKLVKGAKPLYIWINNNGSADLIRDNTPIQQKFVQNGGHFGLEAIKRHLEKYPDFIKGGGKYQIPKDFYNELKKYLSISAEEAKELAKDSSNGFSYSTWAWIHKFFKENDIAISDLEPAHLDYSEVQRGRVSETARNEEAEIREKDRELREKAVQDSRPTLQEGLKVTAFSAIGEGGITFCLGVARKLKAGKKIGEFTAKDWKELGVDTAKGTAKGGIRGAAVYVMTNFTATPAAVANALVTAAFGVAALADQLHQGKISEEEFIVNAQVVCLDVSVSAISSILGNILIPIPVLGSVLGNIIGMFLYELAKENLSDKEQKIVADYRSYIEQLNHQLDKELFQVVERLKAETSKFSSILELAFDLDVNVAFAGSIQLAVYTGVEAEKVLKNINEIDKYFQN